MPTTNYLKPAKGTGGGAAYGSYTKFGMGMPARAKEQKGAASKPGSGAWGLGFDPADPTVDAQVEAWLAKHQRPDGTYVDNKGNPSNWMNQIESIRAQNPGIRPVDAIDLAMRAQYTESAKPPRTFDPMMIIDPIIEAGLGFINPGLSALYGAGRSAGEGGNLLDVALGGASGYFTGTAGANIGRGVSAAGGPVNYLKNLGTSAYNTVTNLPSTIGNLGKDALNTLKYGPELTNVNAAMAGTAPWATSGAAAGMSNAGRVASAGNFLNNFGRGGASTGGFGSSAAGGGNVDWGDIIKFGTDVALPLYQASQTQKAIKSGTAAQTQAANSMLGLQRQMFEKQLELSKPWYESGSRALAEQERLLGLSPAGQGTPGYGSLSRPFSMADFQQDPGYAFRLKEGMNALERSAAARGGLLSGGTGRALTRYGQEMGSQEYQNAFDRYYKQREAMLNPLQSLSGVGQTTASQMGAAGTAYGAGASQTMADLANLQANRGLTSQLLQNQMLNNLVNRVSAYGNT